MVAREFLHPSPTNPRKHFNAAALKELSESMRSQGVVLPLVVRAHPERPDEWEIVAGERRWRAAEGAGLMELPVLVRVLSDCQVREIQLVENLQRQDVSAYEEAVGYDELLKLTGDDGQPLYSIARLAHAVGQSEGYVSQRLRVCRAPQVLLEALEQGLIAVRVCEIVGRIPSMEDRERAAEQILNQTWDDRPMTVLETQELVSSDFMVSLDKAGFDKADAELLPAAGVCAVCPHRSGNDPEIQSELAATVVGEGQGRARGKKRGVDPNLCLNPACYRAKEAAAWERLKAADAESVLPDDQAAKIMNTYHGGLAYNSGYVDLAEEPDWTDHQGDEKLQKPWRDILKGAEVKVWKARDPKTGRLHELVRRPEAREAANKVAVAKGKPEPFPKAAKLSSGSAADRAHKEELERKRLEGLLALDSLSKALEVAGGVDRGGLERILRSVLDQSAEACKMMGKWLEVTPVKSGLAASGREMLPGIMELAADTVRYEDKDLWIFIACATQAAGLSWAGPGGRDFAPWAEALGIQVPAIKAAAKAKLKSAKEAAKAKKKTPKGKRKGSRGGAEIAEGLEALAAEAEEVSRGDAAAAEGLEEVPSVKDPFAMGTGKGLSEDMELLAAAAEFYKKSEKAGEPLSVKEAADAYSVNPATLSAWLVRTKVLPAVVPLEAGTDEAAVEPAPESVDEKTLRKRVRQASEWYDSQDPEVVSVQAAADKHGVSFDRLRNFRLNQSRKRKA